MKELLNKFKEAEEYVDMQREYNTETYEKVYEKSNHQNNYCIDCKHCIGEPTILVSEDTGLWAMAYSCLGGNPKKKGMFTCKEKACEFFEERDNI